MDEFAPLVPPANQPFKRSGEFVAGRASLNEAWRNSASILVALKKRCEAEFSGGPISCIAVAGSLGRMESLLASDVDAVIVAADNAAPADCRTAVHTFEQIVAETGYTPPKPGGVFSDAAFAAEIVAENAVGKLDEPVVQYGKRMHLLLEAQPIFGLAEHEQLIARVLRRWCQTSSAHAPWWAYLQNDIVRYWRALQIDYQWRHIDSPERFRLRNLKLHLSRRTAIAGLLFILGAATLRPEPLNWLASALRWTPVERVYHCMHCANESLADEFLQAYSQGHAALNASNTDEPQLFRATASIASTLARFIAARPGWACEEFWNRLVL